MEIGSIIDGKYKISSVVGKGGSSVVYKALNINLGTEWAIKVINKGDNSFDLLVEPNLLKKLAHQSLPRIVDILEDDKNFYIIEDFVDGTTLQSLLLQIKRLPEESVIKLAKELASVLIYLHEQEPNPIIYRDMKPGNIMLTKKGDIKLIDFGIAREYKSDNNSDTAFLGTRGYAAPEQYGKHQTDERSDIYSLGVTLYHLITGKGPDDPPFEIKPVRTIDSELSEGIEHVILKATRTDPEKRYSNARELLYDLNNLDKLSSKYKKNKRKVKLKFAGIVSVFLLFNSLIIAGAYSIKNYNIDKYLDKVEAATEISRNIGLEEAEVEFKEAIEMLPNRDEGYLALSEAYMDNLQYSKAIRVLQIDALKENKEIKSNDTYHYLLGLCLFSKTNYSSAKGEFSKIKSTSFEGLEEYKKISEMMSSPEAPKGKTAEDIIGGFKRYVENLEDGEKKISGYLMLSDFYRDNPQLFENGEELQIEILEKAVSQGEAQGNIQLYERLAAAYFQKGLYIFSNDEEAKKNFDKSLENYQLLLKLGYETSSVYRNMGVIYRQLGEYESSEGILLKVTSEYPNDISGYTELAILYNEIENKKSASERNYSLVKKYYEKAKNMDGADTNMQVSRLKILIEDLEKQGY